MGEMADYALEIAELDQFAAEDFLDGHMSHEEAFDRGYIEPDGSTPESMEYLYDSRGPMSLECIDKELQVQEHVLMSAGSSFIEHSYRSVQATPGLNAEAEANRYKERPTCNICRQLMGKRDGRYGVFYFCINQCEGQSTVSDKYWQSIRL